MKKIFLASGAVTIAVAAGVLLALAKTSGVTLPVAGSTAGPVNLSHDSFSKRGESSRLDRLEKEIAMLRAGLEIRVDSGGFTETSGTLRSDEGALEGVVKQLTRDVAILQRELTALTAGHSTAGDELPDPGMEYVGNPPEAFADNSSAAADQSQQRMESHLATEEHDPDWSDYAAEQIHTALQSEELAGTTVTGVECRSTLCRVELASDDHEAHMAMSLWLPEKVVANLDGSAMYNTDQADGSIGTVIYFVRKGRDMPQG